MKTTTLTIILTVISLLSVGQTLTFQGGLSYSKLDFEVDMLDETLFNDQLIGYSFLIGMDYADNKFFNLSTNIGVIRKGGKDDIMLSNEAGDNLGYIEVEETLDYFTINTTFDLKYELNHLGNPFVSVGPRFDYLINYSDIFDELEEFNDLNKYNMGLIIGFGYKYEIFDVVFGLRADYYANFLKIAEWDVGSATDETYTITATIGYKIN
jgi:hypothetical protein